MTSDHPGELNFRWAYIFADMLASLGVRDVCISPGSRSTPLTLAFSHHPGFHQYSQIDERSAAFFALGLSKSSGKPTVLICTSGTAAANYFPAIIEAAYSNIPLIVCTADRPPELHGTGVNQTIDQQELYGNKVRWFQDVGLPDHSRTAMHHIAFAGSRAFAEAMNVPGGPVHINFPFRKPLEPESPEQLAELGKDTSGNSEDEWSPLKLPGITPDELEYVREVLQGHPRGVIFAGPDQYTDEFYGLCVQLAEKTGYPIIADGLSGFRFRSDLDDPVSHFASTFLLQESIRDSLSPDVIVRFGRLATNNVLNTYMESNPESIQLVINPEGFHYGHPRLIDHLVVSRPEDFCRSLLEALPEIDTESTESSWSSRYLRIEHVTRDFLQETLDNPADQLTEPEVFQRVFIALPAGSRVFLSNSMPVRDVEHFAFPNNQMHTLFFNRGASGIDGIISTAAGVAAHSESPSWLITGDLAFLHDLNGLLLLKNHRIPLTIILIDNNGGGIFEMLPVSAFGESYRQFIATPHNLDFQGFVETFGGKYFHPKTGDELTKTLDSISGTDFSVIHLRTDRRESMSHRQSLWESTGQHLIHSLT